MRFRLIIAIICCLSLLTLAGCGSQSDTPKAAVIKAGTPAPDFSLATSSGQTITLSALRGQKVVLNFWASWCGPCKTEMPDLQAMSNKYEGQIKLIGVNLTSDDDLDRAKSFMLENGLTFPSVLDVDGTAKKSYGIIGLPVTMTIDGNGTVVERRDGQLTHETMDTMFTKLLQQP
jgi:peroxiredoxin